MIVIVGVAGGRRQAEAGVAVQVIVVVGGSGRHCIGGHRHKQMQRRAWRWQLRAEPATIIEISTGKDGCRILIRGVSNLIQ
jgi:hypothetical protein